MSDFSVVILAAGQGTRMKSDLPKVLHPLTGKAMLRYIIETAQQLKPQHIYVVIGHQAEFIQQQLSDVDVTWIQQREQLGTGHAVMQVLPHLQNEQRLLILLGDTPLITVATLQHLLVITGEEESGLLTVQRDNPAGLGRIIRDEKQNLCAIVEEKEASPAQKNIKEINTGIMVLPVRHLRRWLPALKQNNSQQEYYLTDIISMAVNEGIQFRSAQPQEDIEVGSVNDRKQLAQLEREKQKQYAISLMEQGVTLLDPARLDIRGDVQIAADVTIDVNVILSGKVTIGKGSHIGPNVVIKDSIIGENTVIHSHCDIDGAQIGKDCQVGPFARLRPATTIADEGKIGNFVETKNISLGKASKANHLTYLGDATIGEHVNIGAGTITCNYDGVSKHHTEIEDGAFIGSNTALVAPVKIGENATIAAGSTITKEAPAGQLTVARARQVSLTWERPQKTIK